MVLFDFFAIRGDREKVLFSSRKDTALIIYQRYGSENRIFPEIKH